MNLSEKITEILDKHSLAYIEIARSETTNEINKSDQLKLWAEQDAKSLISLLKAFHEVIESCDHGNTLINKYELIERVENV